jgi:hypothetical protein
LSCWYAMNSPDMARNIPTPPKTIAIVLSIATAKVN